MNDLKITARRKQYDVELVGDKTIEEIVDYILQYVTDKPSSGTIEIFYRCDYKKIKKLNGGFYARNLLKVEEWNFNNKDILAEDNWRCIQINKFKPEICELIYLPKESRYRILFKISYHTFEDCDLTVRKSCLSNIKLIYKNIPQEVVDEL